MQLHEPTDAVGRTASALFQHNAAKEPPPGVPEERIYEVVRAIPRGRIATYGQLAEGVRFDPSGHVSLREFGWLPTDLPVVARRVRSALR